MKNGIDYAIKYYEGLQKELEKKRKNLKNPVIYPRGSNSSLEDLLNQSNIDYDAYSIFQDHTIRYPNGSIESSPNREIDLYQGYSYPVARVEINDEGYFISHIRIFNKDDDDRPQYSHNASYADWDDETDVDFDESLKLRKIRR